MTLIDVFILLIAAVFYFFAHAPLAWTVIFTLAALAIVRLIRGEQR